MSEMLCLLDRVQDQLYVISICRGRTLSKYADEKLHCAQCAAGSLAETEHLRLTKTLDSNFALWSDIDIDAVESRSRK